MADLELQGRVVVHLGRGWFHWVDVKVFDRAPGSAAPLEQWIGHAEFNDHYCGPARPDPPLHGPYRAAAVEPGSFRSIAPADAVAAVREFCRAFEGPADALAEVEHEVIDPIERAEAVWTLGPPGPEARHDWAWVLEDFAEFVVVGPSGTELRAVVVGGD